MRIRYQRKNFADETRAVIAQANQICADYAAQGYDLTLRQLYYQFVARDLIENSQRSYKRLGSIVNDARLAGSLDWDYIVDRTRNVEIPTSWESPAHIIEAAAQSYRIDRWEGQPYRIEVWVEKDALGGVIERACERDRVPWFSCRGYTSQSEIWGAAQRLRGYVDDGQVPVILHLGDHDPSGIDMTRDIRERLSMFMTQDWLNQAMPDVQRVTRGDIWEHMAEWIHHIRGENDLPNSDGDSDDMPLIVERIALNSDQVDQYQPPPNPAKLSDSRAREYVLMHGYDSWELDALEPTVLGELIHDSIDEYRHEDLYQEALERESTERARLRQIQQDLAEAGDEEE